MAVTKGKFIGVMALDMNNSKVHLAAVENADKRLKERPNTICAWADYDAGLIQGFMDGAEWTEKEQLQRQESKGFVAPSLYMLQQQIIELSKKERDAWWGQMVATEKASILQVENDRLRVEIETLKRQNGWMQETIDKLQMENIERDFGKRGDSIKDLKKGIKAFLMANGRYAGSSETAQILREIADEWDD